MSITMSSSLVHQSCRLLTLFVLCALPALVVGQVLKGNEDFRAEDFVTVATSSDGKLLAIARSNREPVRKRGWVELWDVRTGMLIRTISGFEGPVWSVSFSPDSRTLVTGSTEFRDSKPQYKPRDRKGISIGELKWWDVASGEFQKRFFWPGEETMRVQATFSPNGKDLTVAASKLRNGQVTSVYNWNGVFVDLDLAIFDALQGTVKIKLKNRSDAPWHFYRRFDRFLFSPDGSRFAALSTGKVEVWNSDGVRLGRLTRYGGVASALAFSPDSQLIAIASRQQSNIFEVPNSEVTLWDIAAEKVVGKLRVKNESISTLQFMPGGGSLLIGGMVYETNHIFGRVKVWSLSTNAVATRDVYEGKDVSFLSFLPDQNSLVLQSGHDVEIREAGTFTIKHDLPAKEIDAIDVTARTRYLLSVKRIDTVAFSPDGKTVSGEVSNEGFKLWNAETSQLKGTAKRELGSDSLLAVSADGRFVVEIGEGKFRQTDLTSGSPQILDFEHKQPLAVAISSDGERISFSLDEEIILKASNDKDFSRRLSGHDSAVRFLTFSSNGKLLASADESGTIKLWDAASGHSRATIVTGGQLTALAVTASGKQIASAAENNLIGVWDSETGTLRLSLKKHESVINALAFSADGLMLASGGDDREAVLWDVNSGKRRRMLKGHEFAVTSLAFSPNGELIASGNGNASLLLWRVSTGKLDRILH